MYNKNIKPKGEKTMIKVEENIIINEKLQYLYGVNTKKYLKLWKKHYKDQKAPNSLNNFGIIDPEIFDTDNGILVIGKETRGCNYDFLDWVNILSTENVTIDTKDKTIFTKYPKMWYNIGRWAKLICNPELDIEKLVYEKKEALIGLSCIAFTNINKVGGGSTSKKPFWALSEENLVKEIIQEEIEIIKPKYIVLCGIKKEYLENTKRSIKIIEMPHPSAMKSTEKMLYELKKQL